MSDIPEAYLRVRERRIEKIVKQYLSTVSPLSSWLIGELFPAAEPNSIESAELHVDLDHRAESGDPLAYGETDIEIIATVMLPTNRILRVGLLIEMKVDARQMEKQGLRYRARAAYRKQTGSWDAFQCILVAPKRYLENAYPMDDFHEAGWNRLVALQDVARVLNGIDGASEDAIVLNQATDATNAWNQPIPATVKFYRDLSLFQRVVYPDVPISINRQRGAGVSVWPSFFENQLAKNRDAIRRKRVQIVHSGKTHVALYIKKVQFKEFELVVRPFLENAINIGAPGKTWQSVRIEVPYVNPQLPLDEQAENLDQVFLAAKQLYDFFVRHEAGLLRIPISK